MSEDGGGDEEEEMEPRFETKKHIKFLQRSLSILPYGAKSLDVNRWAKSLYLMKKMIH